MQLACLLADWMLNQGGIWCHSAILLCSSFKAEVVSKAVKLTRCHNALWITWGCLSSCV